LSGAQAPLAAPSTPPTHHTWKVYYYAGAQMIAMRELTASGGNTLYFLHGDQLGSTSLTTSITGTVVSQQWYYPYGAPRAGGGLPTQRTYTGQIADEGVGSLMYFNARYMSPLLGRFVSADTIVPNLFDPQSLNRYSYSLSNPLKYTDPSGHSVDCGLGDPGCRAGKYYGPLVGRSMFEDITQPLESWDEAGDLVNPKQSVAARLLLSEMGERLVTNANWKEEAVGILWTIQNRVAWMEQVAQGTDGYESTFDGCNRGFVSCATADNQYATTTTTRGIDPLFQEPSKPGKVDSYYGPGQAKLAVAHAAIAASLFVSGKTVDSTQGATYFSHAIPECSASGHTCFARQVDTAIGSYHKPTVMIPYVPQ